VPYNNLTSRTDAQAEIPEEVARDLVNRSAEQSAALQIFRRVPVSRGQVRFPVLSALPVAYWVNGDTGLKQTTEINWANKFLNIEEIATIVPVPDNVVDDMDVNIWDEVMPYLTEAVGRTLDAAVFFGTNAPASFPTNIAAAASAAGNVVTSIPTAANGGYMGAIDNTIAKVEEDGFDVTGFVASTTARGKFRAARNTQGDRIDAGRVGADLKSLDGSPITYAMRGMFAGTSTSPEVFALDGSQFVLGVRKDITLKVLTEAVIQDNTGAIIYNLAQQDMTALRLTFRVGWQVANLLNYDQPVEASRYPAAVLQIP
jgi:HK97 family phage major capsid protein